MAKLTCVYRSDEISGMKFSKRQLPLSTGDNNFMMLMDLNSKGLVFDHPLVKGKELEEFTRKYSILSADELKQSLEVDRTDFMSVLSQSVPCVGCRRSVERLYYQLMLSGHPTLDPIVITEVGILTVLDDKIASPQAICTLLHKHNVLLNSLLENQHRNKKSSRCALHSRDSFRSRPFSDVWRDVWNCMKQKCRDEISHINADELHVTLEGYLKKHKFCQECRTKVEKAYTLLVNESNPTKEKGYVAALYSNIKKCIADKHIHLQTKVDFIDSLMKRAEPELNGSNSRHRENSRHAKTLEIAQEEVLTCIGICIYERLLRVHMSLKEEENACQVLAAVAVHALCRSFDISVENKRGISNLELLYKELDRAEKAKELRKEQKKLKKKKKKIVKKLVASQSNFQTIELDELALYLEIDDNDSDVDDAENANYCSDLHDELLNTKNCLNSTSIANIDHEISIDVKDELLIFSCHSCEGNINGGCSKSIDGGYASEPSSNHDDPCSVATLNSRTSSLASSSPEGSEVACSDEFCSHHNNGGIGESHLTLQQMLDDHLSEEEHEISSIIPDEVVLDFKCREQNIRKEREELRQNLRKNFARMCDKTSTTSKVLNK